MRAEPIVKIKGCKSSPSPIPRAPPRPRDFTFDGVYGEDTVQADFYEESVPLVENALGDSMPPSSRTARRALARPHNVGPHGSARAARHSHVIDHLFR